MRQPRFATLILVATLCVTGCVSRFDGDISFVNRSERDLAWVIAEGFPRQPPCGILIKGATKQSFMGSMALPDIVTIVWRFEGGAEQRSLVPIPPAARDSAGMALVLEFTEREGWQVKVRRNNA